MGGIELSAIGNVGVTLIVNLDGNRSPLPCCVLFVSIALNRNDLTDKESPKCRNTQRCTHFQNSFQDFHTHNDWILLVENVLRKNLDNTWEDSNGSGFFSSLGSQFVHESCELIKQVINDIGRHDSDSHFLGMLSCFPFNGHIECQNGSVLWMSLFVHDGNLCDITLVNSSDTNGTDWNGRVGLFTKKLQQSFQGSKGRCLHQDSRLICTELSLQIGQIRHDFRLDILFLIIGSNNHDWRTRHDLLEVVTNDLDTQGSLDFLVMNVFGLDTHLSTWWRSEQTTNFRNNRSIQCTKDSLVTLFQVSVDHQHINRHTQTINGLDFQDSTLQVGAPHELLPDLALGHLTQQHQDILNTLSSDGRCGDEWNEIRIHPVIISHFPVNVRVDSLFLQLNLGISGSTSEFGNGSLLLFLQCIPNGCILASLPSITTIHLVEGNYKGNPTLAKHGQRFNRLLFQTVHQIDHQNGNIAQRGTTGTKVGERLVTWCINDEHTRNLKVKLFGFIEFGGLGLQSLLFKKGGTNLLCNTSSFSLLDIGLSNLIQQFGLSSIDVTHNDDNRTTQIVGRSCCQIDLFLFFPFPPSFFTLLFRHHCLLVGSLLFGHHCLAFFFLQTLLFGTLPAQLLQSFLFLFLFEFNQIDIIILHGNLLHSGFQIGKLVVAIVTIGIPFITRRIIHLFPIIVVVVIGGWLFFFGLWLFFLFGFWLWFGCLFFLFGLLRLWLGLLTFFFLLLLLLSFALSTLTIVVDHFLFGCILFRQGNHSSISHGL
mmetsp:Transcript_36197/g.87602  ORF Transcript_36197/g.87602 Transcript_36197/m.87602 type:complete len:763 (+) Transcript_36197:174-2462(+)